MGLQRILEIVNGECQGDADPWRFQKGKRAISSFVQILARLNLSAELAAGSWCCKALKIKFAAEKKGVPF